MLLFRARDFLVHRNAVGRVQFHHENSTWTMMAILQHDHPELSARDPYVKKWLRNPSQMLCPEPGCKMAVCEHNLVVYARFVEVLNSVDLTTEFNSERGLSRFTGTHSEFELNWCDVAVYKSSQLRALFDDGFDYATIYSIVRTFASPAVYSDNARLTPVLRRSEVTKWNIRCHFFKFMTAGGVLAPKEIVTFHFPAPPLAKAEYWKQPKTAEEDEWLSPMRKYFEATFDDFDYRPLARNEVRQLFDIQVIIIIFKNGEISKNIE